MKVSNLLFLFVAFITHKQVAKHRLAVRFQTGVSGPTSGPDPDGHLPTEPHGDLPPALRHEAGKSLLKVSLDTCDVTHSGVPLSDTFHPMAK